MQFNKKILNYKNFYTTLLFFLLGGGMLFIFQKPVYATSYPLWGRVKKLDGTVLGEANGFSISINPGASNNSDINWLDSADNSVPEPTDNLNGPYWKTTVGDSASIEITLTLPDGYTCDSIVWDRIYGEGYQGNERTDSGGGCTATTDVYSSGTRVNFTIFSDLIQGRQVIETDQGTQEIKNWCVIGNKPLLDGSSNGLDCSYNGENKDRAYYSFNNLSPGQYIVSVPEPSGYDVGYTLCENDTTCHDIKNLHSGHSAVVNVPDNGYVDLWWHYIPSETFSGFIQGRQVTEPGQEIQDWCGANSKPSLKDSNNNLSNPICSYNGENEDRAYYSFNNLSPGQYTVSVPEPSGYDVGYTFCYNRNDCHGIDQLHSGHSAVVNVPDNGYVDLWWHYIPSGTIAPDQCNCDTSAGENALGRGDFNCDGTTDLSDFTFWVIKDIQSDTTEEFLSCSDNPSALGDFNLWLNKYIKNL